MRGLHWKHSTTSALTAGSIGTFLTVLNVIVGFAFQALLAATLGVDALADTFQLVWMIVTFGAVVQFSMVLSLLVPRLQSEVEGAGSVGHSSLPLALGAASSGLQALAAITMADGDARLMLLAAAPAHFFVGATSVPQALAYLSRRFWIAGVGPVANGMALLLVTLFSLDDVNALVLGVAVTVGYVAQWAVTAVGTRDLMATASREITIPVKVFLGVLGFTLVSRFQPLLERILSYQLPTGTTAALGYGQKIATGLVLFATFGLATASIGSLARHHGANSSREAADLLARMTLATLVAGSAVCALALPAAYPAVVMLFERGTFTPDDSRFVTNVVILQLPWVWAGALTGVFTAYLYVVQKYRQVLLASLANLAVTLIFGFGLSEVLPKYAIAIASSAGCVTALIGVVLIFRSTDLWDEYRRYLRERWQLAASAVGVLTASGLIFGLLRTVFRTPNSPEYAGATLVTLIVSAIILLGRGAVRSQLMEALRARL